MALKEDLEAMLLADKGRLEELTHQLDLLKQEETELKKNIESAEHLLNRKFGVQINMSGRESKAAKLISEIDELGLTYKSIPDGAFEILSEMENKPLHIKDIYQQLMKRGKRIGNPSSVGVALTRDRRFSKIGPNVFLIAREYYKKESAPIVQEDRNC